MNTFRTVVGHRINIQKSVASLYTSGKHAKKEIRDTISFIIAYKKFFGLNLTEEMKAFYNEKSKALKKEVEADIR